MMAGKSEGCSFGRWVSRISCGNYRGSRIEPAADASGAIDIENATGLSVLLRFDGA